MSPRSSLPFSAMASHGFSATNMSVAAKSDKGYSGIGEQPWIEQAEQPDDVIGNQRGIGKGKGQLMENAGKTGERQVSNILAPWQPPEVTATYQCTSSPASPQVDSGTSGRRTMATA